MYHGYIFNRNVMSSRKGFKDIPDQNYNLSKLTSCPTSTSCHFLNICKSVIVFLLSCQLEHGAFNRQLTVKNSSCNDF